MNLKFWASNADPKHRQNEAASIYALGPVCEITINKSDLPRPVSEKEGRDIAASIESFILNFSAYPTAEPPFPDGVKFHRFAEKYLNLPGPA
jgi:hypothetical protein